MTDLTALYFIFIVFITLFISIKPSGLMKGWWYKKEEQWKPPEIKHNKLTKYNWMVSHPDKLTLGENTDIGAFTYIQAEYGVKIGKNVQIGSHCSIYSKNTIDRTNGRIIIEDNVKIGSHSVILPNPSGALFICHDSVIGAFSLIKQSIPSNSTLVGIPARRYI